MSRSSVIVYWKSVKLEDCGKDYVILNFYIQFYPPVSTGWVKKKWDLKKLQIALTHSILKLKSNVIPLNQMSQSGEKHAQD